jgi:hypothetical protein
MKKLEKIPKNNIYKVPDGYFEQLPMKIQARIETRTSSQTRVLGVKRYALYYAIPVVALLIVAVLIFKPRQDESIESMLSSVSTEQLITYLEDNNLTTDELLDNIEFDEFTIESIENEVYSDFELDEEMLQLLPDELEINPDSI